MSIQLLPDLFSTDPKTSGNPLQYALVQLKGRSITSDGLPARRQALGSIRVPESTRTASQVSVQRIQCFMPESFCGWNMSMLPAREVKKSSQEETVSKKIQDVYTAKHHTSLVQGLPSEEWTAIHNRSREEEKKVDSSYRSGYLHNALQQNPTAKPPVFRIDPSGLQFVFAGSPHDLTDSLARASIVQGNYIRCPSELGDVILTDATTKKSCTRFVGHLLRDMARVAAVQDFEYAHRTAEADAKQGLPPRTFTLVIPSQPYSDTPVFTVSPQGFKERGDLTNLPQPVKQHINRSNFTVCPSALIRTTRLSGGMYKPVGVIIAGTDNPQACKAFTQSIADFLPDPSRQ